jgi:hypothetical protein
MRVRRLARYGLAFAIAASLCLTGWSAWRFLSDPLVQVFAARAQADVSARLERELATAATAEGLGARLDALLAASPHDWARIEAVADRALSRVVALPPATAAALAEARDAERGWLATGALCARCAWDATVCDFGTAVFCRAPIEISPLGDLASLAAEAAHAATGAEVDEIALGLSILGVGATVATLPSGGTAMVVKAGAGLTKTAYRMGTLSKPLVAAGRRVGREAIAWDRLARTTPATFVDDLRIAVRPRALAPLQSVMTDVGAMVDAVGPRRALALLRDVDDARDARALSAAARAVGDDAPGAVAVLGKSKVLRAALRWSDEAIGLAIGLAGLGTSIVAFGLGLAKSAALRRLRRVARAKDR